jgi:hypothetical protein
LKAEIIRLADQDGRSVAAWLRFNLSKRVRKNAAARKGIAA